MLERFRKLKQDNSELQTKLEQERLGTEKKLKSVEEHHSKRFESLKQLLDQYKSQMLEYVEIT